MEKKKTTDPSTRKTSLFPSARSQSQLYQLPPRKYSTPVVPTSTRPHTGDRSNIPVHRNSPATLDDPHNVRPYRQSRGDDIWSKRPTAKVPAEHSHARREVQRASTAGTVDLITPPSSPPIQTRNRYTPSPRVVDLTDSPPRSHTDPITQTGTRASLAHRYPSRATRESTHIPGSQKYTYPPVRSSGTPSYSSTAIQDALQHSTRTLEHSQATLRQLRGHPAPRPQPNQQQPQDPSQKRDQRTSPHIPDSRYIEPDREWDIHVSGDRATARAHRTGVPRTRDSLRRSRTPEQHTQHIQQQNTRQPLVDKQQRRDQQPHGRNTPYRDEAQQGRETQVQQDRQQLGRAQTVGANTDRTVNSYSAHPSRDGPPRQTDQRARKLNNATSYSSAKNLFDSQSSIHRQASLSRNYSHSSELASASQQTHRAHLQRRESETNVRPNRSTSTLQSLHQPSRNMRDYIDVEEPPTAQSGRAQLQGKTNEKIKSTGASPREAPRRQTRRSTPSRTAPGRETKPGRPSTSSVAPEPDMIDLVTDDEADDELRKQLSMALYGPQQPQVKTSRANIVDWNVEATGYWTKKENRDEFNSLNQSFQDISFLEEPSPSLPTTDRHFKQIPIPPDGRERVKRVWRRRSFNDSDVVASGLQCSVTQRDLCRLDGLEWLNDSLVNMYMAMINDRANRSGASVPRVHCFNSHFLPKLRHDGYEKMQRWTKRVDLFSMEYVIVPVHRGSHWTTAIINFVEKRFEYYDSLAGGGQDVQDLLRMYLDDECMAKKGRTFPLEDWADFTPVHLTPQQDNGSDCGVFACQFSEYRSRGSSGIPLGQIFDFGQEQMPYFRLRMAHEILEKRLMIS